MTRERITFEEVVIYAKQKFPAREGKTRTKDRTQTYIRCPFSMRQCMVLYEGERRPYGNTYETTWIIINSEGYVSQVPTRYISKYEELPGFTFSKKGWERMNNFLEEIKNG